MLVVVLVNPNFYNRANGTKKIAGQMEAFAGTERQCTEDEHDSQTSEFGFNAPMTVTGMPSSNSCRFPGSRFFAFFAGTLLLSSGLACFSARFAAFARPWPDNDDPGPRSV